MNVLDIAAILIMLACVISCYQVGLVQSLYKLCSNILSIILAWQSYPITARLLRGFEPLYGYLKNTISKSLNLDSLIYDQSLKAQTEAINSLPIPHILRDSMLNNNNPVLYKALNVTKIEDYISGYLTNICINILAFLLVYIIVKLIMQSIAAGLDIITKLPVINSFNKLGGIAVGAVQGIIVIWLVVLVLVFISPAADTLGEMLQSSRILPFFYNKNLLLNLINEISI